MNDRFLFNAVVSSYYDIDTPEHYEEFEPKIYLENVDLFSDEIGIDYDRLFDTVQKQLNLEKPEISQIMQHFEDNSNSNSDEYVTIKPDRVLQCTGLKDKNGKLIFEGDIVTYDDRDIYPYHTPILNAVIEMRKYQWCMVYYRKDIINADTREPAEQKTWLGFDDFITSRIEVIGNIYQDSHLLEN